MPEYMIRGHQLQVFAYPDGHRSAGRHGWRCITHRVGNKHPCRAFDVAYSEAVEHTRATSTAGRTAVTQDALAAAHEQLVEAIHAAISSARAAATERQDPEGMEAAAAGKASDMWRALYDLYALSLHHIQERTTT